MVEFALPRAAASATAPGHGQRRQVEAAHGPEAQVGARRALGRDQHRGTRHPGREDGDDARPRRDRVAQHRRRADAGPVGGDRHTHRGQHGAQERSGEGDPGSLDPRERPQLAEPGAVALEPRPLGAGVAAQAGRGQQHEAEQERRRAAADQLQPPGRDGVGAPQRHQRVGRAGEAERGAEALDAARRGGLAVEQAADLPVVQRLRPDGGRPAVGAVERREHGQGGDRRDAAGDQHRRGPALGGVRRARERAQGDRQRSRRAPDDDQAQAGLGHGIDRPPARLDDLAAGGTHVRGSRPDASCSHRRGSSTAPSSTSRPPRLSSGNASVRAGRAGAERGQRRRGRPVEHGIAAGGRRAEPGRGEAALGDRKLLEARSQAAVGGDGRSTDDAAQGRGRDRDAGGDQRPTARPRPRSRRRDPKRRPRRPQSGSHIGARFQPRRMFAFRRGGYKRESASGVFTPRERCAAGARWRSARPGRRTRPRPRR